jgi:F420-non-reducing hydrogenase iron-sulfur subunit
MSWEPRMVVFQCQFCLHSDADQEWMETRVPDRVKLVQVPCTGRISPLVVLNALQGGADGVLISGCAPEACHYREGNLGARRQLEEYRRFMHYLGLEQERIRFAWIDPTERGRIQKELGLLEQALREVGPATRFVTRPQAAEVALHD